MKVRHLFFNFLLCLFSVLMSKRLYIRSLRNCMYTSTNFNLEAAFPCYILVSDYRLCIELENLSFISSLCLFYNLMRTRNSRVLVHGRVTPQNYLLAHFKVLEEILE